MFKLEKMIQIRRKIKLPKRLIKKIIKKRFNQHQIQELSLQKTINNDFQKIKYRNQRKRKKRIINLQRKYKHLKNKESMKEIKYKKKKKKLKFKSLKNVICLFNKNKMIGKHKYKKKI